MAQIYLFGINLKGKGTLISIPSSYGVYGFYGSYSSCGSYGSHSLVSAAGHDQADVGRQALTFDLCHRDGLPLGVSVKVREVRGQGQGRQGQCVELETQGHAP